MIEFVWDFDKDKLNRRKHGVSFEEAKSVFYDEKAKIIFDPDHSQGEERFIILGMSDRFRTLVVFHCYRENDQVIRIITARKATKSEQRQYSEEFI